MPVGEIQHYHLDRGRTHRAAPLSPFMRFTPANDNRPPRSPWRKWLTLAVAGGAMLVMWAKIKLSS